MVAKAGDYIIRGVHGELYPCKPDIFKKTYEEVEAIEHLKSTNWIPVSERLPEIKKNYLECYLVTDDRFCWMAYLASEKEWVFAECTDCKNKIDWTDVVAWMPLPELYKED